MSEAAVELPAEVAEVEPGAAPEPVDAAEASASGSEPAAPSWAPDPNEWAQVMDFVRNQQTASTVEEPASPQATDFFQPDEDGNLSIDMQGLERYIDARAQMLVDSKLGEVGPVLDETIRERGEKIVEDRLTALESEVGTFDHTTAGILAQGLLADMDGDPFAAIKQAATMTAAYEKRIADKAVEAYKSTIGAIGDAPNTAGVSGAAVDYVKPRAGLSGYDDVANNWSARHTLA